MNFQIATRSNIMTTSEHAKNIRPIKFCDWGYTKQLVCCPETIRTTTTTACSDRNWHYNATEYKVNLTSVTILRCNKWCTSVHHKSTPEKTTCETLRPLNIGSYSVIQLWQDNEELYIKPDIHSWENQFDECALRIASDLKPFSKIGC